MHSYNDVCTLTSPPFVRNSSRLHKWQSKLVFGRRNHVSMFHFCVPHHQSHSTNALERRIGYCCACVSATRARAGRQTLFWLVCLFASSKRTPLRPRLASSINKADGSQRREEHRLLPATEYAASVKTINETAAQEDPVAWCTCIRSACSRDPHGDRCKGRNVMKREQIRAELETEIQIIGDGLMANSR